MHGVERLEDLGTTVPEYRARFELRYGNGHRLTAGQYPMERALAGEIFSGVVVEVTRTGEKDPRWTHRIRSLVLLGSQTLPDCPALILNDETKRRDAEE